MNTVLSGQAPILAQVLTLQFWPFCSVLRSPCNCPPCKILQSELKVTPLSSHTYCYRSFWYAPGATTSSSKVSRTPVCSLLCSIPRWQYKACILLVTNVAEVWQCRSTFQHDTAFSTFRLAVAKYGRSDNEDWFGSPVAHFCIWGGHGESWTIQAPPLCNRPLLIFGTWAMSAHGCLFAWDNTVLKTIAVFLYKATALVYVYISENP